MPSSSSSSAAPPTTTTPTSKPGAWLAALQQRFIKGQDCDVIIRASIELPSAKRVRADDGITPRNGAKQQQQQGTVGIPCHSVILNSRSRYFEAALSGAYTENQQRTVEIELADEQAVEDLRLLIKLSCGLSYGRCAVAKGHVAAFGVSG